MFPQPFPQTTHGHLVIFLLYFRKKKKHPYISRNIRNRMWVHFNVQISQWLPRLCCCSGKYMGINRMVKTESRPRFDLWWVFWAWGLTHAFCSPWMCSGDWHTWQLMRFPHWVLGMWSCCSGKHKWKPLKFPPESQNSKSEAMLYSGLEWQWLVPHLKILRIFIILIHFHYFWLLLYLDHLLRSFVSRLRPWFCFSPFLPFEKKKIAVFLSTQCSGNINLISNILIHVSWFFNLHTYFFEVKNHSNCFSR